MTKVPNAICSKGSIKQPDYSLIIGTYSKMSIVYAFLMVCIGISVSPFTCTIMIIDYSSHKCVINLCRYIIIIDRIF